MLAELDQLTPNYLTVNPDGTVGALFPGGVQMVESLSAGYGSSHALGWLDAAGVVREYIQAAGVPVSGPTVRHDLFLNCQPDASDNAFFDLLANESGAAGASTIQFGVRDSTQNPRFGTVIDSNGASSFLQLLSAQELQLAEGSGTWTWPGGSTNSNLTTINHGLGRAPRRVLIEPTVPANWVLHLATNRNSVSFDTTAQFPSFSPGAGYGVTFDWIAFG